MIYSQDVADKSPESSGAAGAEAHSTSVHELSATGYLERQIIQPDHLNFSSYERQSTEDEGARFQSLDFCNLSDLTGQRMAGIRLASVAHTWTRRKNSMHLSFDALIQIQQTNYLAR